MTSSSGFSDVELDARSNEGGLRHLEVAILGLPVVKRRFRHPLPPSQTSGLSARFCFPAAPNDLLRRNPYPFHVLSLYRGQNPLEIGAKSEGQVLSLPTFPSLG